MHHALEIAELVEIICGHVAPSEELRRRKDLDADDWHKNLKKERTLALDSLSQFARTSRMFLDPVLNALWSYQGTIVDLLRVMPGAWMIKEKCDGWSQEPDLDITQLRPLTTSDRDRFLFYARRVKSFSFEDEGFFKPPKIYDSLRACIHETCILPNLQRLHWPPRGDGLLKHVQLFLSPAITHLTANMISSKNIPVLSTFTLKCPHVKHLTIWADEETPQAILPISKLVCALQRLQFLDVPGLDARALVHIARLPTLQHLRLTDGVGPMHACASSNDDSSPLTDLKFRSGKVATSSVVETFISALCHHCAHAPLQDLCLRMEVDRPSPPIRADNLDSYVVGEDILKPLFSFGNLVSVQLAYPVGFDIDDAVVRNMARAWPRLEALILPHHHPHHLPPIRVTLTGVYSLAKYCPLLERLTMSFDATVTPPKIKRSSRYPPPLYRVYHENLWFLDVADSPIAKAKPVAKFLNTVFPWLDEIKTFESTRTIITDPQVLSFHRAWKKVAAILEDLIYLASYLLRVRFKWKARKMFI
ncbi:hypothetical protein C8F04DRAFT_1318519 [Mycena alexandri]|uniref:F-box domain-containing protein n=1 Tax=Mycena alexandri TaxID=1745969 RepID=A0AAD6S4E1_9AGAR|nr:hypothetical protein C8F04DRAFT_1318519 [Mycena alexandri]